MRPGLFLLLAISGAFMLSACGEQGGAPSAPSVDAPEPVSIIASDELPGLAGAPTGVDFWAHPNVAFNSLMIVAGEDGLASYNIEDGNEVSRIPGIAFDGAAVSYIGFGPLAAGFAAAFDAGESRFRFYGVDNSSRLFLPLPGGPEVRGAVRDFCMGRATASPDPSLFVVQKDELKIFNLTPDMTGGAPGVAMSGATTMAIPGDAQACAVDMDGVVLIGSENGAIYRLDNQQGLNAPFANAGAGIDAMAILSGSTGDAAPTAGFIATLNAETGVISLFDRTDGHALGAISFGAADNIDAVTSASAMGAASANLGALYRDGAIALGVGGNAPAVRLIPANAVVNNLSLPVLTPGNPRGTAPAVEANDNLIINPTLPASE